MGKLIYSGITSLDGYTVDASGHFDWSAPDEELHAFVNDLQRPIGTYLYGRAMYDVMVYWEATDAGADNEVTRDFAQLWQAAEKVVFSRSLTTPRSKRTRILPSFDSDTARALKAESVADISIGGTILAAEAIRAGLVDEYQQFLAPVIVGGGRRFLPDDVRIDLELIETRRFANGAVFVRYRAVA
jgi:dihydrofolate reductase